MTDQEEAELLKLFQDAVRDPKNTSADCKIVIADVFKKHEDRLRTFLGQDPHSAMGDYAKVGQKPGNWKRLRKYFGTHRDHGQCTVREFQLGCGGERFPDLPLAIVYEQNNRTVDVRVYKGK